MENRGDETDDPRVAARLARAEKALRQSGRELKWWQIELEHTTESLQRARRQRARLREQVDTFSDALAATLSRAYWADRESRGTGVARLVGRRPSGEREAGLVRQVEASGAFDGGWYLRAHPQALRSGLSPALHYVRHGNAKRLDPGPSFSTAAYLERHPEATQEDLPALVHAIRHDRLGETSHDDAAASPASDLHL
ncbi:hypothetical protein [Nocardioides sp. zg-1228]|uniref:hypothetical protein n=1 Tax=Nocardioides sp. zg-1228 TaxID=2763008 RepID=UPI0016434F08|nr:hypothetical protein [Nocardioides sp. zg-1228]MBC2933221.1 hypothetical protein [Nocardioides sp. zg-1228]QSF56609.1 hypothetical protein JX575_13355 [Nocardioides sp. zg-1228]